MSQPNAAHPAWRCEQPAFGKFVGYPHLSKRRLFDRQLHNRLFDMRLGSVLHTRLTPADLLQRQLAALLVQFFEPVEAIARVAHHLASLGNTAEHVGKVQKAHFVLDDLLIGVHWHLLRALRALYQKMSDQVVTTTLERPEQDGSVAESD